MSPAIIASVIIAPAILETILARLALLFLAAAKGDMPTARDAASRMLAAYKPENEDEFRLAAEVVTFSFYSLEALSQSAAPDLAVTRILRLRGSAVSLHRQAHRSQRKLDQLQRDRRAGPKPRQAASQIEASPPKAATQIETPAALPPLRPQIETALQLIDEQHQPMPATGKTSGISWTQVYQQRQTEKRLAKRLQKRQARTARQTPGSTVLGHDGVKLTSSHDRVGQNAPAA